MHLHVATPMYGGQCAGHYVHSLINLLQVLGANGVQTSYQFLFNESLITRARNTLVHGFLQGPATHLLFVDADIAFNPQATLRMLQAQCDVLVGICPKKEINWATVHAAAMAGVPAAQLGQFTGSFVVNPLEDMPDAWLPGDQPFAIKNGGTGFMLIARKVFETLAPKVPEYLSDVTDLSGNTPPGAKIKAFFDTSIDPVSQRLYSEDFHFCKLWREQGGQIHAAPWADFSHVGTHVFTGVLPRVG